MKKIALIFALFSGLAVNASTDLSLYDLEATWRNQRDEPVVWSAFRGRPMVVCLFFSHCGYACPRITADMLAIAAGLPGEAVGTDLQMVMASFDTERDTPAMLAVFAEAKGIPSSWQLLHGDGDTVRELAAALDVRYRREPDGNFAHGNAIILLDAAGRVVYRHEGLGGDLQPITTAAAALVAR